MRQMRSYHLGFGCQIVDHAWKVKADAEGKGRRNVQELVDAQDLPRQIQSSSFIWICGKIAILTAEMQIFSNLPEGLPSLDSLSQAIFPSRQRHYFAEDAPANKILRARSIRGTSMPQPGTMYLTHYLRTSSRIVPFSVPSPVCLIARLCLLVVGLPQRLPVSWSCSTDCAICRESIDAPQHHVPPLTLPPAKDIRW